jgi:PTH1 family peptidyl-tRNA hydrolase
MKYLIVGLGNIGPEYHETRHNVGFIILDKIASKYELNFKIDRLASVTELKHKGKSIVLIKPTTYMNLSGRALQYWMNFYKIPIENVLVIVDDLALPVGKLRLKVQGSSAGHNGLKNIEEILGHNKYPRLKVGIGDNFNKGNQVNYVLGKFTKDEQIIIDLKVEKAIEMILSFCLAGIGNTMNIFNE